MPLVPIPVDVELGGIFEAAQRILERRGDAKEKRWTNLDADLEAIAVIVRGMDDLYVAVLDEVQWSEADSDDEQSQAERLRLTREIHRFVHDDNLISLLTELRGKVQVASQGRKVRPRQREIATCLRGIERSLSGYLEHWEAIQAGAHPLDSAETPLWNLADVLRCLEKQECPDLSLRDLCEQAIRNRRRDLTLAISLLVGEARQNIGDRHA